MRYKSSNYLQIFGAVWISKGTKVLEKEKLELNISGINAIDNTDNIRVGDLVALSNIKNSLKRINFELTTLDINCLVNISFGSPDIHTFMPEAYNIFYSAIKSDDLLQDEIDSLNRAHEVWTPTKNGFNILTNLLSTTVKLVPFGVSGFFMPTKRKTNDVFSFVHIGEQDGKKSTQEVVDAFVKEFGHDEKVSLTLKTRSEEFDVVIDDGNGNLVSPDVIYKNIHLVNKIFFPDQYLTFIQTKNCLVYPTIEEDFGFVPLECMATGMPVISTSDWSDYADEITYKLKDTSVESIRFSMREAYENRENDVINSFYNAFKIHREWTWDELFIGKALDRLKIAYNEEIISNSNANLKVGFTGINHIGGWEEQITGYSISGKAIFDSIKKAGVNINYTNLNAPISISYSNPELHIMFSKPYNVLYSCHETTGLSNEWTSYLNKGDEIWASSTWVAESFKKTVSKPVYIMPLGISDDWKPKKRDVTEKYIFLHNGEPSIRKGGQATVEAFIEEFGNNENVILIIKTYESGNTIRIDDGNGNFVSPERVYSNILIVENNLTQKEYLSLLYKVNCLVYPSWGEGFGLIPLEALATGIPVISTWEWAEYKDEIKYKIESDLVDSQDNITDSELKRIYFGEKYLPKIESIRYNMKKAYENHLDDIESAYSRAFKIHNDWNWRNIVETYHIPRLKEINEELKNV